MIDSAFGWIGDIVRWFGQFFPQWKIVITTQGAVKFKSFRLLHPFDRRMVIETVQPGFMMVWPLVTDCTIYPTARQANNLREQTLVTVDNQTVTVGAVIVYEIHDLEAIIAHTYDPEETIMEIAMTAVHEACCKRTWQELLEGQRRSTLDTVLKNEVQKQLRGYGVTVLKVALTDLAPTRVYRLMQTQSSSAKGTLV